MPRVARVVIPGLPHHVTQRGNNYQDVFFVDDDRRVCPGLLAEQAEKYGPGVLGCCLMTNHVHLLVVPAREDSLARAVGRTHSEDTRYLHALHGRSGDLWQNRRYPAPWRSRGRPCGTWSATRISQDRPGGIVAQG